MHYQYKFVTFYITHQAGTSLDDSQRAWVAELERVVNQWAAAGWEFMNIQNIALPDVKITYQLLAFRSPVAA